MKNTKIRSWNKFENHFFYFQNGKYFKDSDCKKCVSERICSEFMWSNAEWCTGLHDKNGKEIFEGDKLRDDYHDEDTVIEDYSVVVWDGKLCQWAIDNSFAQDGSSYTNLVEYFGRENLEIIGNIHEDSCLLE